MKAENHSLRGSRKVDIAFTHGANRAVDDIERYLVRFNLAERFHDRFTGTLRVGLYNHLQCLGRCGVDGVKNIFQCHTRDAALEFFHVRGIAAFFSKVARGFLVVHHVELITGFRHSIQAQQLEGVGRRGLLHAASVFINQRARFPVKLAANDNVAHLECAFAHEHSGYRAALFHARLDHVAHCAAIRIGLELEQLRLQENCVEQLFDAFAFHCGHINKESIAAPIRRIGGEPVLGQLLPHAPRVGGGQVAFVDRHNDRGARGLGVIDALNGLRHHAIVGGHHEHDKVGHICAARTHGTKGCVAGRVEKCDGLKTFLVFRMGDINGVGADVLGDPTGFAGNHIGVSNGVEQRRLAVIHMAHHGDHRRPRLEILCVILDIQLKFLFLNGRRCVGIALAFLGFELEAVLGAKLLGGGLVNGLVDIGEHAELHEVGNELERFAV